ncbi:MAG: pilin [Patescibacteria group bacterium]
MKKYLFLFLIISGIILPVVSFAGLPNFNGPIVTCGRNGTGPESTPCTLCDVFKMAQTIFDWIIGAIILVGPILIAVGGLMILFAGADPGQLAKGKSVIKNVIIGLIIALLAWTVINMIFNELTDDYGTDGSAPWNKINCTGGGINEAPETPPVEEGGYCVCETPVYDLSPTNFPSQAKVIATDAKISDVMADAKTCKEKCVLANSGQYCSETLGREKTKMYCASKSGLQSVKACGVGFSTSPTCQLSTTTYTTKNACMDIITPETGTYNSTLASKCWLDGEIICQCISRNGGYQLYQQPQHVQGGTSLFDCATYADKNDGCRINCDYQKCGASDNPNKWCTRTAPSGSDKWILSGIKTEQKGDASSNLTSFLNCMYAKIPSGLTITSISDDKLCSASCTPSTGSGCSHTANSCHYGGSKCSGYSYAIDFGTNVKCSKIRTAALQCNIGAWTNWESDHTHVSINNTDCGCAESGSGNSCDD